MNLRSVLSSLRDPSTKAGTAFWASLAVVLYDVARHGVSWQSGAFLCALAGLDQAARWLGRPEDPSGPSALPVASLA